MLSTKHVDTVNMKPLVSLIIITTGLNTKNIEQLLKSIATQSFKSYEVIVACETNRTLIFNACKNILPGKCRVIETGFWNRCRTANVAIKRAKGDYVALLEDDLVLDSQWLEKAFLTLVKGDKNTACVYTKVINPYGSESLAVNMKTNVIKFLIKMINTLRAHAGLSKKRIQVFSLATLCKKKALMEAGLFDIRLEEPIVGEDYELAIRINKLGYKIRTCSRALAYHYSLHATKRIQSIPKRGWKWWEHLIMNDVYVFVKHMDLLGLYAITHMIYKCVFEPLNVFIRLRLGPLKLIKLWCTTIRGILKGFLKGILHERKSL